MKLYCGIDPGLHGALAIVDEKGQLITVQDTPVTVVKKGKKNQTQYLPQQMADLLAIEAPHIVMVALELVHAMPGQGTHSMFVMGEGAGIWVGILAALKIPFERVTPQAWKKLMLGHGAGSDKSASILRASQLISGAAPYLTRKKDDGRAEALLLAEYVRRSCR